MNELTNKELDSIVEAAKESRNDDNDMLKIKEELDGTDDNSEIVKSSISTPIDSEISDINTAECSESDSLDMDLFSGEINMDNISESALMSKAKNELELTDDEVMCILNIISEMQKDPHYPVYKNMPDKLKDMVNSVAATNGLPKSQINAVARMIMLEFINDSEIESIFIDLEKSINEALKIPSIMDLYTEHTQKIMLESIPKAIEEIKDIDPEKANMLSRVKEAFDNSYTFSKAKEEYEKNSRLRKCVRKHEQWFAKSLDEFNYRNEKSNFKMNDVRELPSVLTHILIDEPKLTANSYKQYGDEPPENVKRILDLGIAHDDIHKLCVLLCKSCENLNSKDVIDAAYMYYMMKNIIILKLTNEAKTDFAAELINNICDTIVFIRNKEAEFNATNMDKSKRKA